jgi:3-hydroxy acid dehydrogenase/malonic semialdehyde reductase
MAYKTYKPETVFITGATGDFGNAFVNVFSELGCKLILHGRSLEKLEALKKSLTGPAHIIAFDMKDKAAMKDAVQSFPDEFADIDLLINNAGGAHGQEAAYDANIDDWEEMIEVNNLALIRLTRLLLPNMVKRKKGHIINIGSIAGTYPYPGGHVYCGVKAFVAQFSLALRADLQGKNIRVTNLEPGMVETQFSLVRFKGDKDKAASVYKDTVPMTADDVAQSALWAATLPEHFNVNRIEMMPTVQAFSPLSIYRFEEHEQ